MNTNAFIQEQLLEERRQSVKRELARHSLLSSLPRQRSGIIKHSVARLGASLIVLGRWLEQVEVRQERTVYDYR